jgi:hypothetical protein
VAARPTNDVRTTMKKITLLLAVLALTGCGGPSDQAILDCENLGMQRGPEAEECAREMDETQEQIENSPGIN